MTAKKSQSVVDQIMAAPAPTTGSASGSREEVKARQLAQVLRDALGGVPERVLLRERKNMDAAVWDVIASSTLRGSVSLRAVVYIRGDRVAASGAGEYMKYIRPGLAALGVEGLPTPPKSWTKPRDRQPYSKASAIAKSILAR